MNKDNFLLLAILALGGYFLWDYNRVKSSEVVMPSVENKETVPPSTPSIVAEPNVAPVEVAESGILPDFGVPRVIRGDNFITKPHFFAK